MKPCYVIYEEYTEYNQFEGRWDIYFKEFDDIPAAKEWMQESYEAGQCRLHGAKLIGPLILATEPLPKAKEVRTRYSQKKKKEA